MMKRKTTRNEYSEADSVGKLKRMRGYIVQIMLLCSDTVRYYRHIPTFSKEYATCSFAVGTFL
jgi:hypothetical protein